ncbi:MAG: hypothetical protein DIU67_002125 [Actinomycetes bacterium]|jgi:hypothetical protein
MEPERHETYERIPWEALEARRTDPGRVVIVVSVAVALGALAFSFMRNQTAAPPQTLAREPAGPAVPVATAPPVQQPVPQTAAPPPTAITEADLYAVEPERLAAAAAAHAEWFAIEYVSADGSQASRDTLASLLPAGVPLPEVPEGVQVYVDWAGAMTVTEVAPLTYEVEVLVRSLVSSPDGAFTRQPPRRVLVEVAVSTEGAPRVTRPPTVSAGEAAAPQPMALGALPESLKAEVEAAHGPVVGGEPLPSGGWRVVVMATDPDGVRRPRTVVVGP